MGDAVFDRVMGGLDVPMFIVTAYDGSERSGCLIGFATQSSIRPSRFLALISKANHTYGVACGSEVLVVHALHDGDHELASRFGERTGDRVDKFEGLDVADGPAGVPVIGGLDWFAGRVLDRIDLGDHVGFQLAPHDGAAGRADEPQLGFQSVRDLEAGHEA